MVRFRIQSSLSLELSCCCRPSTFTALVELFKEPQYLSTTKTDEDPHAVLTDIDFEEQTAGYQAAYSRLAASETPEADPVAYIRDPQQYLGQELVTLSKSHGSLLKSMIAAGPSSVVGPFVQALAHAGYVL